MFRLRKLLDWKESLEKEALAERIAAENRAQRFEEEVERLRSERWAIPEDVTGTAGEHVQELEQWSRYSEGLRRREESLRARLGELRPQVEQKVAAHVELRREVEGLRRLEERERRARRKLREKRQQESIDDAASRRKFPDPGTDFRVGARQGVESIHAGDTQRAPETDFRPSRGMGR